MIMAKTVRDIMNLIKENDIKMVDFKMVDVNGQYRHVTIPAENFSEETMKSGIGFDASNYGYAVVEKSDMVFIPDPDTAVIDPFCSIPTLSMTGNAMIIDNPENRPLPQYPRNIIKAAVEAMKARGVADTMLILPEFEFYLFDQVNWSVEPNCIFSEVDAQQSYWNSATEGKGVIVPKQKNYHIAKPFDVSFECRSEMCMHMKDAGIEINYHHPEVAASGQFEIEPQLGEVVHMADATMMIKYIIHNTALKYGKTAIPNCEYETSPLLREVNVGNLENQPSKVLNDEQLANVFANGYEDFGGESNEHFYNRVVTFAKGLESSGYENVAVFTHAGWLRRMLNFVVGLSMPRKNVVCNNCTVGIFEYKNGIWRLYSWINVT